MVAELAYEQREITRASVIALVQEHVDGGMEPNEAFARVFADIEAEGRLEDLARLHGVNLVGTIWRSWNIENRPAAVARTVRKPNEPVLSVVGSRVVEPEVLRERSLLDSMHRIGGHWVRVADMCKPACLEVFKQYRKAAIADEHNARFYRALAESLADGQRVADQYDEARLMKLFNISKPPGQTLA